MDNTSNKDEQNQSQLSKSHSSIENDNTFNNNKESEIDTLNKSLLKLKRQTIFKLDKNDSANFFNTSNEAFSYLNRRKEKLSKNRISAKKCRLKKKEYVSSLEKKLKQLHKQLEEREINDYSKENALQTFLMMTIPRKLSFLSQRLCEKSILLFSKERVEDYFNDLNSIRMTFQDGTDKGNEYLFVFDVYVNQLKSFIKGLSDYTENNLLLKKFYPKNESN